MDAHNRSFSLLTNAAPRRARHGVKRDQVNVDDYDKVRQRSRDALFIAAKSHRLTIRLSAPISHTNVVYSVVGTLLFTVSS